MENIQHSKLSSLLARGSILLSLTLISIIALKLVLSDCGFLSSRVCNENKIQNQSLSTEIDDLKANIATLRREITKIKCVPNQASKNDAPKEVLIDETLWSEGKVEVLDGCWVLDWDYKMRRVSTGEVVGVKKWSVCFNSSQDIGVQDLVFDDGDLCISQPVKGSFSYENDKNLLILDDITDVKCETSFIYRRQLQCELALDASYAMCDTRTLNRDKSWSDYSQNNVKLKRSGK